MNEKRKRTMKAGTKIGAALGVIEFLVFQIVPVKKDGTILAFLISGVKQCG